MLAGPAVGPERALAGMGLVSGFYEWLRQAEFSGDRAGLLVCQDTRVAYTAIMKLGGGATRLDGEMNVDLFLDQARHHAEGVPSEGIAKALMFFLYNWQLSHPQVVFRVRELEQWVQSGEYERVLGGHYARDEPTASQPDPPAHWQSASPLGFPSLCPRSPYPDPTITRLPTCALAPVKALVSLICSAKEC